jgi:hypothetical protein
MTVCKIYLIPRGVIGNIPYFKGCTTYFKEAGRLKSWERLHVVQRLNHLVIWK